MVVEPRIVTAVLADHRRGPNLAGAATCLCGWHGMLRAGPWVHSLWLSDHDEHVAEAVINALAPVPESGPTAMVVSAQVLVSPDLVPPCGAMVSESRVLTTGQWRLARAATRSLGPVPYLLGAAADGVVQTLGDVLDQAARAPVTE